MVWSVGGKNDYPGFCDRCHNRKIRACSQREKKKAPTIAEIKTILRKFTNPFTNQLTLDVPQDALECLTRLGYLVL
jgi:hypothetical protein